MGEGNLLRVISVLITINHTNASAVVLSRLVCIPEVVVLHPRT